MNQFTIREIIPPQESEKSKFIIHGLMPASQTPSTENLTNKLGLVRETNSPSGVLGHEVVVFRKRRESLDYFRTLRFNERISNIDAMFKEFTSYLVDVSPKSLKFSQRFIGENYPGGIEIDFTVEYHVEDSARLCHHLASDPIGKMRDKMVWFFKERFSSQDPAQTASILPSLRQSLLQDIQEFAQRFGLAISMVDLQSKLREDIVRVQQRKQEAGLKLTIQEIEKDEAIRSSNLQTQKDQTIKTDVHTLKIQDVKSELEIQKIREEAEREKQIKDTDLKIELAKKQLEYESLKRDVDLIASAKAGVFNAGVKAVENIVADIDSASDLPEKIDQFTKAINKLRELFSPTRPMLETTTTPASFQELPRAAVAVLGDQETNTTHLLNEFFFQANNSITDSAQQKIFKVAISNLKSQLGLGSQQDPEIMRLCWENIDALLPDENMSEDTKKLKVQLRTLIPQNH